MTMKRFFDLLLGTTMKCTTLSSCIFFQTMHLTSPFLSFFFFFATA